MAHKLALINMKGGVGKSTLAVNLAWEMVKQPWKKKVLVVDLDPQFNCSQYLLGVRRVEALIADRHPTVWDIFEQLTAIPQRPITQVEPSGAVVRVFKPQHTGAFGSIDLIPSRLELSQSLRNPAGKELLLKRAIDDLEQSYDLVIIDCAPTESMLTTAAYLVADHLLVPVRPEFLSTIGLPLLEQSLANFSASHPGCEPKVLGLVFNAISGYSPEEATSKTDVHQIARKSGWSIFDQEVAYSKSFPKSAREGKAIFLTSYVRRQTKSNFHRFAREFAERLGI